MLPNSTFADASTAWSANHEKNIPKSYLNHGLGSRFSPSVAKPHEVTIAKLHRGRDYKLSYSKPRSLEETLSRLHQGKEQYEPNFARAQIAKQKKGRRSRSKFMQAHKKQKSLLNDAQSIGGPISIFKFREYSYDEQKRVNFNMQLMRAFSGKSYESRKYLNKRKMRQQERKPLKKRQQE